MRMLKHAYTTHTHTLSLFLSLSLSLKQNQRKIPDKWPAKLTKHSHEHLWQFGAMGRQAMDSAFTFVWLGLERTQKPTNLSYNPCFFTRTHRKSRKASFKVRKHH
jgi:hypothetical protein